MLYIAAGDNNDDYNVVDRYNNVAQGTKPCELKLIFNFFFFCIFLLFLSAALARFCF